MHRQKWFEFENQKQFDQLYYSFALSPITLVKSPPPLMYRFANVLFF